MFRVPEVYRVKEGDLAKHYGLGNNGAFELGALISGRQIRAIASDGEGWEHVSVSIRQGKRTYTPTWPEMCYVKGLFWEPEDVVMQLHPAQSKWVNNHESVLHLWRPVEADIPLPPAIMVGVKGMTHAQIKAELAKPGATVEGTYDWLLAQAKGDSAC